MAPGCTNLPVMYQPSVTLICGLAQEQAEMRHMMLMMSIHCGELIRRIEARQPISANGDVERYEIFQLRSFNAGLAQLVGSSCAVREGAMMAMEAQMTPVMTVAAAVVPKPAPTSRWFCRDCRAMHLQCVVPLESCTKCGSPNVNVLRDGKSAAAKAASCWKRCMVCHKETAYRNAACKKCLNCGVSGSLTDVTKRDASI